MNFDLALVLVVLTALSGAIWLIDKLAFAPKRAKQASTIEEIAALSEAERNARMLEAMREPVLTEYARSFFPVLLLILIFRSFIAEPFKIPSAIPAISVNAMASRCVAATRATNRRFRYRNRTTSSASLVCRATRSRIETS